ncbi:hypothetical protein [Nostoc sp.]
MKLKPTGLVIEEEFSYSEFRSGAGDALRLGVRINQSGIGTGAGIVAPPNLRFGGAKTPVIHPPVIQNTFPVF